MSLEQRARIVLADDHADALAQAARVLGEHWDIAGTAFTTSQWKYFKAGGTGWGVKSLVEVARNLAG